MFYFRRLKSNFSVSKGLLINKICILITCLGTLVILLINCNSEIDKQIYLVLSNEKDKITSLLNNKYNYLFRNIAPSKCNLFIDDKSIRVCDKGNCYHYDLSLLRKYISEHIPDYLDINLFLSNDLVFVNTSRTDLIYFSSFILNNQIEVMLGINISKNLRNDLYRQILKNYQILYFFIILFATAMSVYYLINKSLIKSYYLQKYSNIIQKIKIKEKQKLWEQNASKEAELKINMIFAKEAKSLDHNNLGNIIKNYKNFPYAIILLNADNKEKIEINLVEFKNDFCNIFNDSYDTKISINIRVANILFNSKALFYQLFYSIIKYLVFFIKSNNLIVDNSINIDIFEEVIISLPKGLINNKKELYSKSQRFFASHCNSFILDIRIVFLLLEYFDMNFYIIEGCIFIKKKTSENNVIQFQKP